MHTKRLLSFLTAVVVAVSPLAAQEPVELRPSQPVERDLNPGERHSYSLELESGMFVVGQVNQLSTDVVVEVFDPAGELVQQFDTPARGPEPFSFSSEASGLYRIDVTPFNPDEPGTYVALIRVVEPVAATPAGRVGQLFAQWHGTETPGAAVAVSRDGEIVLQGGYGSAQLEYGIPITPETVFHVASVSKQVTAFAVTMLADQGELSLDDDIRDYLPEIPDFGETITIRHLIHHTSGLRDQWNLLAMAGWRLDDVITRDQILRLMSKQQELNFSPGDELLYCNTGYTLLGEIVARVSGQSFADWSAENIFAPLGMTATHFHDDHELIVPDRAYSYAQGSNGFRKAVLSYANAGATSLFTTVRDMTRWLDNLEEGTVGGGDVISQVHQRAVLNNGDTLGYASGLSIGEYRGLRTVGHGGADAGFRSQVLQFPDEDLDIVVFSNLASSNPGLLARQIADIYLEGRFVEPDEAVAPAASEPEEAVTIDPEGFDDYIGAYQLRPGFILTFTRDGGRFFVQATGQSINRIFPSSDSTFFLTAVNARVTFNRDEAGAVHQVVLHQGGRDLPAPRVEPFTLDEAGMQEYVGRYYSPELETAYSLEIEDGRLTTKHQRHDDIPLTVIDSDRFETDIWFFSEIRFERDETSGITGMRVSNGRVRNLLFERVD